jgi:N6-L-threonylcarbamoyladenine synthase
MARILGIETSCDETGIAIYDGEHGLLSHALHSQIALHNLYGGVVPELASRDHVKRIIPLINNCFAQAQIDKSTIDAIAYTAGPGLNGALLVGASIANGLGFCLDKPVIPIHHLEGHLLSPLLGQHKPQPPFIALLASGGHSQIIMVEKIGKYRLLGDTLDDAAGEAFDKTAKLLGLPYPGGSHIAALAKQGIDAYKLPRPMLHSNDLNFSFSGLKTAVSILIDKIKIKQELTLEIKHNIAKSIEEAITDVLVKKSMLAIKKIGINRLVISGGVSANLTLRDKLNKIENIEVFYPPQNLCTDNGAMIALAGHTRYLAATYNYSFVVNPRWQLSEL